MVGLARRILPVEEGDASRDPVGAEPALQPGRITQFADVNIDIAVSQLDYRPCCQLDAGRRAGLVAPAPEQSRPGSRPP